MSTWNIDTAHSAVEFSATHMMVSRVRGQFSGVGGTITFDGTDPLAASVEATIPAATVHTGMEPRDNHLRGADFLDVERFPALRFQSTGIEPAGARRFRILGELTIRDVNRPVVIEATLDGIFRALPMGDGPAPRKIAVSGSTKISRKEWGLNWNVGLEAGGWLVSDEIKVTIDVQAAEARAVKAEVVRVLAASAA